MKKPDPFAQAPEFLAAFNHIATKGFFEEISFSSGNKMAEGEIYGCSIDATGCVPNNKKYQKEGAGALISPEAIIASCKAITGRRRVKRISVTVKTSAWALYDEAGEKVIGSKGTRTEMHINISFVV
jgi:hypothetical protein